MTLGDMLAGLDDEAQATEMILGLGDMQLLAGMRARAATEETKLASYVREAVERYTAQASDEEWITLMGLIGRSDDPARICFRRALEFALKH